MTTKRNLIDFEVKGRFNRSICLVVSCLAIYGGTRIVLGNDPLLSRKISHISESLQPWSPVPMGINLPKYLNFTSSKKNIILIAVNSCIKCSFSKLVAADILGYVLRNQNYTVVFVTQDSEQNIDAEFLAHGKPKYCKVICDPGKLVINELSIKKTPQFAVFEKGKSVYSGNNSMFISESITDWLKFSNKTDELDQIRKIASKNDTPTLRYSEEEPCANKKD